MKSSNDYEFLDHELLVVQEAARLITRGEDTSEIIHSILHLLSQMLGLNRGRILLKNSDATGINICYAYGLTKREREQGHYYIGEGITGQVFLSGQVALIQNIDEEPNYLARAVDRKQLPDGIVAYIAVPIIREKIPVGVLAVHRLRRRERPFQRDISLLRVVATIIDQVLHLNEIVEGRTADLTSKNKMLRNKLKSKGSPYGILGVSKALQESVQQALQVAETDATVLILGESGTGKGRFARMIHMASNRSGGPFISINCASIPANLLESELFGYEKGAFTGATSTKRGIIEMATGGTLFLDEIGDLNIEMQAKILHVLESKKIQRVGSNQEIKVDVRTISATHKNLQKAVIRQEFRLDLFYRLNVFPIRLAPLRSRNGDIEILAQDFLERANQEYHCKKKFDDSSLTILENYNWPGNIRQLENVITRSVLMAEGQIIDRRLIEKIIAEESSIKDTNTSYKSPQLLLSRPQSTGEQLRPYARIDSENVADIVEALRLQKGNKTRAAISLGLTPRQLRYRMLMLGIDG